MISKRAFEVAQPKPAVDVERYRREGYLTAPSVFSSSELDQMRREADRLLQLCAEQVERYARRIEWESEATASPLRSLVCSRRNA